LFISLCNTIVKTKFKMDIKINHFKVCTIQDYVADDVVLIWQLVDDVSVDDVDPCMSRE
jgi:hypothetical protein